MEKLKLENVSVSFQGLKALSNVSFSVSEGMVTSIIGPNGAGKTTLLNVISGIYLPSGGNVFFNGENCTAISMSGRANLGMGRTFQHVQLVPNLSVVQNAMLGLVRGANFNLLKETLLFPFLKHASSNLKKVKEVLRYLGLTEMANVPVQDLPFGYLRMVELARVLVSEPSLILMDEPAAGLSQVSREDLMQILNNLKREGVTILLVDHDMDFIFRASDHIIVLNLGEKIYDGNPFEVENDALVKEVYLG